jgi:hypothetical protein
MRTDRLQKDRILSALESRGRNQAWLAEQIGVTPQAITKAFATGSMSLDHAIQVARCLDVSLDWLVGLETRPGQIGQVINGLPDEQKQLSLDFVLYQIDRADERLLASEQAARYTTMIEGIKRDIAKRRSKP